jgi:hypothetical protein
MYYPVLRAEHAVIPRNQQVFWPLDCTANGNNEAMVNRFGA